MNHTFSWHRIGLLLKLQWLNFRKIFLITLGAIALLQIIIYIIFFPRTDSTTGCINLSGVDKNGFFTLGQSILTLIFLTIIYISITAHWFYSGWGKTTHAMRELLVPATLTEKYICGMILTIVIALGSYMIVTLSIDMLYRLIINHQLHNAPNQCYEHSQHSKNSVYNSIVSGLQLPPLNIFATLITLHSFFYLGGIYFKRFQYIKTLIILLGLLFALTPLNFVISAVKITHQSYIVHTPEELDNYIFTRGRIQTATLSIFAIISSIVLYIVTYFRMKEKEI